MPMNKLNNYSYRFIKPILLKIGFVLFFAISMGVTAKPIDNAWKMPPLILDDLGGQQRQLYDWHGKVILLNFWATWCGPCQIEIPDLIRWQQQYADQGLQIVSVGLDDVRKLSNFARTVGINYPVLVADPDQQFSLLKQWGDPFGVLPFTVVIGKDGHFVFMQQGLFRQEAFESIVLPLLSGTSE
jgi:thiol-disulfide isomerase/thioredoxin